MPGIPGITTFIIILSGGLVNTTVLALCTSILLGVVSDARSASARQEQTEYGEIPKAMTLACAEPTSDYLLPIVQQLERQRLYLICKRLFDLSVAVVVLLMMAPVMLIVALLVVLDTPGPAIFRQDRVGPRRRAKGRCAAWQLEPFTFYKFRTMHKDADPQVHRDLMRELIYEEQNGTAALQGHPAAACPKTDDPRVTRVGRLLRRTCLDELPQLWNVLIGDMSLVGPRPPTLYEFEMYSPRQRQRLAAIPGITGLWQVNARRKTDFGGMVALDLYYIEHRSFWLDLKILVQTPLAILHVRGAGKQRASHKNKA